MFTSFFFYTSYIEAAREIFSPGQYRMYIDAIISYGLTGSYSIKDPEVEALFSQIKYSIDASKRRYAKAKSNGAKGGRPPRISKARIRFEAFAQLRMVGAVDFNVLAYTLYCSKKTIERALTPEYIRHLENAIARMRWDFEQEQFMYREEGKGYWGCKANDFLVYYYVVYFHDKRRYELYALKEDAYMDAKGHPCTIVRADGLNQVREFISWIEAFDQ